MSELSSSSERCNEPSGEPSGEPSSEQVDEQQITSVAIAGAGVIGSGWAARMLACGVQVRLWDPNPQSFVESRKAVERAWPALFERGIAASSVPAAAVYCESLADACQGVQWVQEAAPENAEIKRALYQQLEPLLDSDCIIASSSSGLLPSELQSKLSHPQRFLVGHPFNPVYLLPLVELVPGGKTSPANLNRASAFYKHLQMKPLVVRKEVEGYLSDRLQEALWREMLHLVNDDIATPSELDDAVRYGPGLRWAIMGTALTFHLAGGAGGMKHMLEQFGPALELPWTHLKAPKLTPELIERMVAGTAQQAGDQSIAQLEALRDECLVSIMGALDNYSTQLDALTVGAGETESAGAGR